MTPKTPIPADPHRLRGGAAFGLALRSGTLLDDGVGAGGGRGDDFDRGDYRDAVSGSEEVRTIGSGQAGGVRTLTGRHGD